MVSGLRGNANSIIGALFPKKERSGAFSISLRCVPHGAWSTTLVAASNKTYFTKKKNCTQKYPGNTHSYGTRAL